MTNKTDHEIIDFTKEKRKYIHQIHEKNLQEMHQAFEKVFPITTNKKNSKKKNKKK